jgi:hypothetical protein
MRATEQEALTGGTPYAVDLFAFRYPAVLDFSDRKTLAPRHPLLSR